MPTWRLCAVMLLSLMAMQMAIGVVPVAGQQRLAAAPPTSSQAVLRSTYPPVVAPEARPVAAAIRASFRPPTEMPPPGRMPAGSYMRTIQERGRLVVGTYSELKLFGFADPLRDNTLVGFDIDIAKRVAKAIFGDADRVQFVTLTSAQRIPLVVSGQVDMVVATMTITAKRQEEVDFSEVYFDAGQRVLVRRDSQANGIQDLSGQRLCVVQGSTGADVVPHVNPHATLVPMAQYTDCLVALRKDEVDAIVSDDVILAGLATQDPYAKIVGAPFTHEPYGIAVAKQHPEFTAFVNGVLREIKQRGEWAALYKQWLGHLGSTPEPPVGIYKP